MNKTFLFILLLLLVWLILGIFFFNKCICNLWATPPAAAAAAVVPAAKTVDRCDRTWNIRDAKNHNVQSDSYYRFVDSKATPLAANSNMNNAISKTVEYLKSNTNRALTVTGYYQTQENNSSIFDNLGLARANAIKRQLVQLGAPSAQLDIASKLADKACISGDTLNKGITFGFSDAGVGNDRLAIIKERLFGKPIILYFGTNQDNIALTSQQRKDFADLNYYLDRVNTARLDVSGHTDNVGNRDYNINLSKERADFVKSYLKTNGGLSDAKMDVAGYGPDKAMESNATPEGRAKNRRVEVTLK